MDNDDIDNELSYQDEEMSYVQLVIEIAKIIELHDTSAGYELIKGEDMEADEVEEN